MVNPPPISQSPAAPPAPAAVRFAAWMDRRHGENQSLRFKHIVHIIETWITDEGAKDWICKLIRAGHLKSLQLQGTTATRYSRTSVETLVLEHIS